MPHNLAELLFVSFGYSNTKTIINMGSSKIVNVIIFVIVVIVSIIDNSNANGKYDTYI